MGLVIHHLGADDVALLDATRTLFGRAFEDEQTYGAAPPPPGEPPGALAFDAFIVTELKRFCKGHTCTT